MEPPYWYFPVNQSLGAALFRAGRLEEARAAFRAALVRAPNNGWALYGLDQTERALGHRAEAAAAQAAFKRAWLGDPRWLTMDRL
jgi:tetratricopeptide (TPR) repeat protein